MVSKTIIFCILTSSLVSAAGTALVLSTLKGEPQVAKARINDSQLEQRISELEDRLANITQQKSVEQAPPINVIAQAPARSTAAPQTTAQTETTPSFDELRERRREQRIAQLQPTYRAQQFVKAGFAEEEAARIVQLEARESLRQLNAQYQARRQQLEGQDSSLASTNPIRAELGDENYERYLEANGWPTKASVGSVIGGSPGENAGLRAGDNIVSYAGERVFNLGDVNLLTAQGRVGQNVLIEVEREGETLQLSIPRGPIGVNSGRRGFRR